MSSRPKALFLDLDDTIYASGPVYEEALRRAWRAWSGSPPLGWPAFARRYAEARSQVQAILPTAPCRHNRLLYFKRLTETLTGACRPKLALALAAAYRSAYREIDFRPALAPLAALRSQAPLGVLTNQICESQLSKIAGLDPDGEVFRWIVTSEEAGAEKPSPIIFAEALRRAGCAPAEAAMAGDSWEVDVLGALAAGWQAIFVSETPPPPDAHGAAARGEVRWVRSLAQLAEEGL